MKNFKLRSAFKLAMGISLGVAALPFASTAIAQDEQIELEEIIITGSRITQPGVVSSSPIQSISAEEIAYLQEPEIEKILRTLPGTIPGDGGSVNNGSAGAATIDLRGLGPERNLIMTNGRRMVPFSFDGEVDTATIPTALVERIDVVTGGASAVYGSDAIAGAINFVLKRDFEGVEFTASRSEAGDADDGRVNNLSLTLGSNLADDRGNIAMSFSYLSREPILLGQRDLGLLGIETESGAGYAEFLAGQVPPPPPAGCGGPNVAASGGSTTSIPTRFAIVGGGDAASGQFREDRSLQEDCDNRFNFNPFNYYQTPMDRYSATALGHFEVNEHAEVYASANFTNVTVIQQVAPSGTFGASFDLPLSNPLIGDQARQYMIDRGNDALAGGLLQTTGDLVNWQDINANGTVDAADTLNVQLRRRTLELGPRSENFDADQFQIGLGTRGEIIGEWDYDLFFSYGESNRTRTRAGYTNLTNIQNALDTSDGVTCNNGDATCVPIDLFGGFGTITAEMAGYAQAIALVQEKVEQTVGTFVVNGPIEFAKLPWADSSLVMSFGYEKRREKASLNPDECLKLAPSSCQGGAGGNLLPIEGAYSVDELFFEGLMPLLEGQPGAESLTLEFGYRTSDYDISSGSEETWKLGFNWRPVDQFLVRAMKQQATRTPNIGELFSPVVTGLENAVNDPCSVANPNISATLRDLCISTGQSAAQVGNVQDIVSGQVNTLDGSDPDSLPGAETADTITAGIVWTPDFDMFSNFTLSVDYYDIDITDVIGEFTAQEILDGCYKSGIAGDCDKINRIGGDLTLPAAGIDLFTTNKDFEQAEGIELGFSLGVALGGAGELQFSGNVNKYLTQESQSSSTTRLIDCKGVYSTSCDPLSELRWIGRVSWLWNGVTVSAQWRHIDAIEVEEFEEAATFADFREIDDYDYLDLFASYSYRDKIELSLGVDNVTDKSPPVVGGEAGDTAFNSGNTFPSFYDVLGRIYTLRLTAAF